MCIQLNFKKNIYENIKKIRTFTCRTICFNNYWNSFFSKFGGVEANAIDEFFKKEEVAQARKELRELFMLYGSPGQWERLQQQITICICLAIAVGFAGYYYIKYLLTVAGDYYIKYIMSLN